MDRVNTRGEVKPGSLGKLELLRRINAARKDPEHFGDVGLYKLELSGGMEPDDDRHREQLEAVAGYHPRIDLQALATLEPGSLGREYADHMAKYKLDPLNVSPALVGIARENPLGARYLVTHDLFHTILGFDTSPAGEVGVYAFAAGQSYSRKLTRAYRMSVVFFALASLFRLGRLLRARRWGLEMGRRAKFLLGCRFEACWEEPLADIRTRYNITPAPTPNGARPDVEACAG